ncbi:hypothetical protein QBC34DRAFT_420572 [Podospora aff. communis PSN243]|uniref:F-box domain-containing protein n=1 Tax=Podospora aff. communis PSN243 TaxID=3040156 RepID=A0AAV9H2Q8_9PEZI|nr:hypothetical protein QBC34DRAFT_420572 [Podospora aff. communis PSN243]
MALKAMPAEILYKILESLDITDNRNLRLVCRRLSCIATHRVQQELSFCLYQPDFDMLKLIASRPDSAGHVASLLYFADMISLERHDFHMHSVGASTRPHSIEDRKQGNEEMQRTFDVYERLFESQQVILDQKGDYSALMDVIAKFPGLKKVAVTSPHNASYLFEAGIRPYGMKNSPFYRRELRRGEISRGRSLEPSALVSSSRHMRALLRGVHRAGIHLQSIEANVLHFSFFDSTTPEFGLHNMTNLLGALTCFNVAVVGFGELDFACSDRKYETEAKATRTTAWNAVMQQGALRNALAHMPNLTMLRLAFARRVFPDPQDTDKNHFYPISLHDVIPSSRLWPKLKILGLEGVMTDGDALRGLVNRHADTLDSLELCYIHLHKQPWRDFLPKLKKDIWRKGGRVTVMMHGPLRGETGNGHETWKVWHKIRRDSSINYFGAAGEFRPPLRRLSR